MGSCRYLGSKHQVASDLRRAVVAIGLCQDLAVEVVGRGLIHGLSCCSEALCEDQFLTNEQCVTRSERDRGQ